MLKPSEMFLILNEDKNVNILCIFVQDNEIAITKELFTESSVKQDFGSINNLISNCYQFDGYGKDIIDELTELPFEILNNFIVNEIAIKYQHFIAVKNIYNVKDYFNIVDYIEQEFINLFHKVFREDLEEKKIIKILLDFPDLEIYKLLDIGHRSLESIVVSNVFIDLASRLMKLRVTGELVIKREDMIITFSDENEIIARIIFITAEDSDIIKKYGPTYIAHTDNMFHPY